MIGEQAFANCSSLRQVVFDPGSAVTEIQCLVFWDSGLESFTVSPSLRKIGALAFRECHGLTTFELNKDVELGWLCLWMTGVARVRRPWRVKVVRKRLGLDQKDLRTLRLPDGLEAVGDRWF